MNAKKNISENIPLNLDAQKNEALRLFVKDGIPGREVAKKLGISYATFRAWSVAGEWGSLKPRLKNDTLKDARHKAAVMYIKEGKSAIEIEAELGISLPTIKNWVNDGLWKELRPNYDLLVQYKAASLYIDKELPISEICEKLSIAAITVKMWADLYNWDAAKLIHKAKDINTEVVNNFCSFYKKLFAKDALQVEFVQSEYLKTISTKI